jgi:SH3-like domain-containing protein
MGIFIIMKRIAILIALLLLAVTVTDAVAEQRLAVKTPTANIRSGPGTQYDVLWQVEKYYPILVIDKSDPWYQFKDFENDTGWVHKSLVEDIETVITRKDLCNIRSGPGTGEKILFTVNKGVPFKVLEHKGQWLHIEHADGDQGWIYDSLVW